jgi:hypothetical protein
MLERPEIAGLIDLEPNGDKTDTAEVESLCRRLSGTGYQLRTDADMQMFVAKRREHARGVGAIADHLGTSKAPLLP